MPRPPRSCGFTLLELLVVVSILGVLVSIALPNYGVYLQRAKATEALINLEAIGYLERVQLLEAGVPVACEPRPAVVPGREPVLFEPTVAWKKLGYQATAPVRYQYEVRTTGPDFTVFARGDLGEDAYNHYRLDGRTMTIVRGP